jgi:serralysin
MPLRKMADRQSIGSITLLPERISYTANAEEAANISSNLPHFNAEGIVYYAHSASDSGGTALYRFYNTSNDSHFFTTSVTERDNIISTLGHYNYEGVAYYVDLA